MTRTPDRSRPPSRAPRAAVLIAAVAATAAPALADDWPQFRGPRRDGVSLETGLRAWSQTGPKVAWRVPLGSAYSGLAVVGDRVFTMESKGGRESVVALATADGSRVWSVDVGRAWDDRWSRGPRATPTVVGGVVFAVGSRGRLVALDAQDGAVRWSIDLVERYGADVPQWGVSASPLVEGGRLVFPVGGKQALAMAFDVDDGRERWRTGRGGAGYTAPLAIDAAGRRQILLFTAAGLRAVAPDDGAPLWDVPWETSYDVNAAIPVFVPPDRVFVSSGYDKGAALFRIVPEGEGGVAVEELWRNREMKNRFSASVRVGDHLYGFDEKTFKCIDLRNGETVWRERGLGHGSLIAADGKLIVLGEQGDLVLVDASPRAYRELARARVFDSKTWTAPSLADGRLYVRDENELAALVIRNEPVKDGGSGEPPPAAGVP